MEQTMDLKQITQTGLAKYWPKADKALITGILDKISTLDTYEVNTPKRFAHFWGQCTWECNQGLEMVENLNYTAKRIHQVWPSRFPTVASATPYAHNPKALGNKVYGTRMGNHPGTDDGYNRRGRGLIQVTGRDDDEGVSKNCTVDLMNHPELAYAPETALEVALGYWKWRNINPAADANNYNKVTLLINGGEEGLSNRISWTKKWASLL